MATQSTAWHDTYATVAQALNLEVSTVKRYVKEGRYPAVKFPPDAKRPEVRLMPPAEYQRLHALHFGPQPVAADEAGDADRLDAMLGG